MASAWISIAVVLFALIFGFYYYENKSNDQLREEFSYNLNKWYEKGKYFTYKDIHRVFYVHEILPENEIDENTETATILLLHGFPTSSYDYLKLWNQLKDLKFKSILSFDYVGYGFSDKPHDYDYSLFDMADLVDSLLMHLGIYQN